MASNNDKDKRKNVDRSKEGPDNRGYIERAMDDRRKRQEAAMRKAGIRY
jgi:hypothetical protein